MKKLIAAILALVMVMSLSVTAFAAETVGQTGSQTVGQNGSQNISVTAKYSDTVTTPDVYSVDITWDSMTFTYSEAGTRDWNPATHTYTENITAGWDKERAEVTVTNHSNVDVDVTFNYVPDNTHGVTTSLSNTEAAVTLNAGVEGDLSHADSVTAALTISGTPNDTVNAAGVVVGTITVHIA